MAHFQAMDILILAAIAGFLIYRLYNVLGEDDGVDSQEQDSQKANGRSNVVRFTAQTYKKETQQNSNLNRRALDPISEKIWAVDPDFDLDAFHRGCEKAFEMIINAFQESDQETLTKLLGPKLFKYFVDAIETRQAKEQTLEQSIEAIKKVQAENVEIKGKDIFITVRFVSEQIISLYNKDGELIQGDAEQAAQHHDLWTFYRNATSTSPVWQLVATQTAEPD